MERLLESIDEMAAQRPVAAQLVAMANSDDTSAATLARTLACDMALSGRVLKLANSAYFGMRGRVTSLQFAVTVVGFMTVRTLATVALTDLEGESGLPDDFWTASIHVSLAAAGLAPRFGEGPPDALCLGVLAQLGAALLHHVDPDGYAALVAETPGPAGRRAAEIRRYGVSALRLTATALQHWGFPEGLVAQLLAADDLRAHEGSLLRAAMEVAARLGDEEREPVPMTSLTCGVLGEEGLAPLLEQVRGDAEELRRAMFG
jgi:HD-like signal output (HDOD) protein